MNVGTNTPKSGSPWVSFGGRNRVGVSISQIEQIDGRSMVCDLMGCRERTPDGMSIWKESTNPHDLYIPSPIWPLGAPNRSRYHARARGARPEWRYKHCPT